MEVMGLTVLFWHGSVHTTVLEVLTVVKVSNTGAREASCCESQRSHLSPGLHPGQMCHLD